MNQQLHDWLTHASYVFEGSVLRVRADIEIQPGNSHCLVWDGYHTTQMVWCGVVFVKRVYYGPLIVHAQAALSESSQTIMLSEVTST